MTSLSYSIQSASGVEYKDMLFFDNMEDNISDITTLGEYSQWNQQVLAFVVERYTYIVL